MHRSLLSPTDRTDMGMMYYEHLGQFVFVYTRTKVVNYRTVREDISRSHTCVHLFFRPCVEIWYSWRCWWEHTSIPTITMDLLVYGNINQVHHTCLLPVYTLIYSFDQRYVYEIFYIWWAVYLVCGGCIVWCWNCRGTWGSSIGSGRWLHRPVLPSKDNCEETMTYLMGNGQLRLNGSNIYLDWFGRGIVFDSGYTYLYRTDYALEMFFRPEINYFYDEE